MDSILSFSLDRKQNSLEQEGWLPIIALPEQFCTSALIIRGDQFTPAGRSRHCFLIALESCPLHLAPGLQINGCAPSVEIRIIELGGPLLVAGSRQKTIPYSCVQLSSSEITYSISVAICRHLSS